MTIKQNKKKMLGILLPPNINEYITLYSIYQEISKTKLGEDILLTWYKNKNKTIPENTLVENIKKCIQNGWNGAKSHGEDFTLYITVTEKYLVKKGLSNKQIQLILDIKP